MNSGYILKEIVHIATGYNVYSIILPDQNKDHYFSGSWKMFLSFFFATDYSIQRECPLFCQRVKNAQARNK